MVSISFARALLLASAASVAAADAALAGTATIGAQDAPPSNASTTANATAGTATTTSPADAYTGAIIVTARRRAESLKDIPIAVTAFTGARLENRAQSILPRSPRRPPTSRSRSLAGPIRP